MADAVFRKLRDGGEEGEYAPALSIKDTIASPFGLDVFADLLAKLSSAILAGKSKSQGLLLVALSRSPSFYVDVLKRKGIDIASNHKRIHILDCYTDPLGWKDRLLAVSQEASTLTSPFKDVKSMDKLLYSIIEEGKGLVGPGKSRFYVAVDSVNGILRHASLPSVSSLISNLRSNEQISSIYWSVNSDLLEARIISALDYMSSMVASVEPLFESTKGKMGDCERRSLHEQDFGKGKFHVRIKLRKGRVRVMCEEFQVDQSGINFSAVTSFKDEINTTVNSLLPKVQFNLQLSEKERLDKERVVLPFEHQGDGKPIQIYDGRRSLAESKNEMSINRTEEQQTEVVSSGKGEIIYFRDSDDERPDSDEDPDDDLDI